MTLVVMAAGMGSRFGGLKQIEPVGPNGEFILDYSIYDAIKAGFKKIVFIIKEENYEIFKNTIGTRIEKAIEVQYAFQKLDELPLKLEVNRKKPWGTGQAILCTKSLVNENFAVINADDFYGRDCFLQMYNYLLSTKENNYGLVGYQVKNTLGEYGAVKRGVCEIKEGNIINLIESSIETINNNIIAKPLSGANEFVVSPNTPVSMNALCFTPSIFTILEKEFVKFLNNKDNDLNNQEFLIPEVLKTVINNNLGRVKLIETKAIWHGITYKEDKPKLVSAILKYIKEGIYPNNLWK